MQCFLFEKIEYSSHYSQVLPDNLHNVHNNHNSGSSLLCSAHFGGLGLSKRSKDRNLSIGGYCQEQLGLIVYEKEVKWIEKSPTLPRPHWSHSAPLEKLTLCRLVKVSLYVWKWCQIFVRGFSWECQRLKKLWSIFRTFPVIQNDSKVEIIFVKPTDLSTNSIWHFCFKTRNL